MYIFYFRRGSFWYSAWQERKLINSYEKVNLTQIINMLRSLSWQLTFSTCIFVSIKHNISIICSRRMSRDILDLVGFLHFCRSRDFWCLSTIFFKKKSIVTPCRQHIMKISLFNCVTAQTWKGINRYKMGNPGNLSIPSTPTLLS